MDYTTTTHSTREQVAEYIEKGLSVRQIAGLLDISTQAVYKHLKVLELPPPTERDREAS